MPELPEVETVRRGLAPVMTGQVIARADIRRPDLRWPFPENMKARLEGAQVMQLRRRSKYILADLDTEETLLIHLGMSGRMLISSPDGSTDGMVGKGPFYHQHPASEKHDHVILDMANGVRITFNDARRFGAMDLCVTAEAEAHRFLCNLGPEPLANSFDDAYLAACLKDKKTPIKSALLDQRVVAGLGNIYVCEALWRSRISPLRKAGEISNSKIYHLVAAIRDVLADAIESGGSSLKDYRQADGELGYFQHQFAVYGKEGSPCTTMECKGNIARTVQSGRSSFYCPQCQR